jgi:transcriptional regulator with XRE-family HTH domain
VTDPQLGKRLRQLRRAAGRSLTEVGDHCGLSASFLSLVENGKSDITIGRLTRLVDVYGVSITDVLQTPPSADGHIIRKDERHHLHSPSEGIDVYLLVRDTRGRMMPQVLEIRPGASLAEPGEHQGEEWLYILSGELVLEVDGLPVRVLAQDDSAYYSSEQRHSFRNPSNERAARVICVNSPPNL